jgi:hypothetical protein
MKKTVTISNKTAIFFIVIFLTLMVTTALTSITYLSSATIPVFAVQHSGDKQKFTTQLSGDQEVPPVQTSASGMAWFKSMQDSIKFELNITSMQGVTQGHIHSGKMGENGPIVVTLYKSDPPLPQTAGTLAKGNITANMLEGPMTGKQISDLVTAMSNGSTYVNVHTQQHPNGEIRGQIMMSNSTTMMK